MYGTKGQDSSAAVNSVVCAWILSGKTPRSGVRRLTVIHFGVGRQGKPDDEMCLSHIEQAPSMCHKGTIFGRTWPNKSHLPVQNVLETVQNFQCGALWNFLARDKKLEEAWRLKCVDSSDVYTCVWLWLACWPVVNCVTCGPIIIIMRKSVLLCCSTYCIVMSKIEIFTVFFDF